MDQRLHLPAFTVQRVPDLPAPGLQS